MLKASSKTLLPQLRKHVSWPDWQALFKVDRVSYSAVGEPVPASLSLVDYAEITVHEQRRQRHYKGVAVARDRRRAMLTTAQPGVVNHSRREHTRVIDPLSTKESGMSDEANTQTTWRATLGAYKNSEVRLLRFATRKEINKAIDALFEEPELVAVPFGPAGGLEICVPAEAVPLLQKRKLRFNVENFVDPA